VQVRFWVGLNILICWIALSYTGRAQVQKTWEGSALKVADYYDPPHETQMRSLIEGAKAQPSKDGRTTLITQGRMQTFALNGTPEMVVEAPQCVYDPRLHSISSSGPLEMRTADKQFYIQGEGFVCQKTDPNLIISNHVHTIIQRDLAGVAMAGGAPKPGAEDATNLDIFSDYFDYSTNSGLATYLGNVQVVGTNATGTNLAVASESLTLVLPMRERRLQSLTAERNVALDYQGIHATGERAIYSAESGLARVTGKPSWRAENRGGHGDELVIDRTNKTFRVNGHSDLKMFSQTMAASDFIPHPRASVPDAPPPTNRVVEVLADSYLILSNSATFDDHVRVTESVNGQTKGTLTCSRKLVTLFNTNELQQMIAENDVVIEEGDTQFKGDKAVYTGTNGVLELTGNPAWRSGPQQGRGDLLLVNLQREEMNALGHASMRFPARELGESLSPGSPMKTRPAAATNQFATISSEEYLVKTNSALFQRHVRLEHPQMVWVCEKLTVNLASADRKDVKIIGEGAVVFDLTDEKGEKVHGACEQGVYNYNVTSTSTNDTVELTGNPILTTTNGTIENSVIILDRAHNKLITPGQYKIYGLAKLGTNASHLFK